MIFSKQQTSRKPTSAGLRTSLAKGMLIFSLAFPLLAPAAEAEQTSFQNGPLTISHNVSTVTSDQIINLRRAIIGQESGANFRAVNPHSGALGYGQVMPENVPSWSREALGYSISPRQFLNSPNLQLIIIDHKLAQYWQKAIVASGGNEQIAVRRVASQWYSGKPHRYSSTAPQVYAGHRYPSIASYTLSVLARYQALLQFSLVTGAANLRQW